MRDTLTVLLFAAACGLAPAALALAPRAGEPVAVVASPWAPKAPAIVAAADGVLIDAGRARIVAIATSDASDFVARLYRAGAALVLDGRGAGLCAGEQPPRTSKDDR